MTNDPLLDQLFIAVALTAFVVVAPTVVYLTYVFWSERRERAYFTCRLCGRGFWGAGEPCPYCGSGLVDRTP